LIAGQRSSDGLTGLRIAAGSAAWTGGEFAPVRAGARCACREAATAACSEG
jgi:hypothetical protein